MYQSALTVPVKFCSIRDHFSKKQNLTNLNSSKISVKIADFSNKMIRPYIFNFGASSFYILTIHIYIKKPKCVCVCHTFEKRQQAGMYKGLGKQLFQ